MTRSPSPPPPAAGALDDAAEAETRRQSRAPSEDFFRTAVARPGDATRGNALPFASPGPRLIPVDRDPEGSVARRPSPPPPPRTAGVPPGLPPPCARPPEAPWVGRHAPRPWETTPFDREARATATPDQPARASTSSETPAFDLVWIDHDMAEAMLAHLRSKRTGPKDELEDEWLEPERIGDGAGDHEGRIAVQLARVTPQATGSLGAHFAERQRNRPGARPLVVVEGELALSFDPHERLERMATIAARYREGDDELGDLVRIAQQALETRPLPEDFAQALSARLTRAFHQRRRELPRDYLEDQVNRSLVADRAHLERRVMGGPHLRGRFEDGAGSLVTYVPREAADQLPLRGCIRLRVVVELRGPQEELVGAAFCGRALALAPLLSLG